MSKNRKDILLVQILITLAGQLDYVKRHQLYHLIDEWKKA